MNLSIPRRGLLGGGIAAATLPRVARAQSKPIRIGVLTDMVGAYAANTGPGSVAGTKLAIEDFAKLHPNVKVELVSADLQLKPDVAVQIAGDWLDNQGVDLITDVPLSSAAFAIGDMVKTKDKAAIFTGGASADITGGHCGPNHLHWVYDTWSMPHAVVDATVKEGGDTWYFITADYAFGHALETDAASFVAAAGGKVLGQALAPFPGTTDFSSHLVQARASGAKVIGFANGGADTVNCIKQSAEFGIQKGGQKIAGLLFLIHDVHGVGLTSAQGVLLTEPFYWNMNDGTRAFAKRFGKLMPGNVPGSVHAGQYSAVMHYLKACVAIGPDKAKASGRAAVDQMKAMPTDDPLFGKGAVRKDGRVIHDMHLFEVKSPEHSKEPWDYYLHRRTVPAAQAFRPIDQGGCKFAQS
ncbi:MAG TPA: ABC transporter permease [Acetobacteraceae bacterium]|jgi:branched-chain amino acid transport system substrate-binding protein|nr:ABC transporter permease [Acetobacteraceae bacterium]